MRKPGFMSEPEARGPRRNSGPLCPIKNSVLGENTARNDMI